jgi:hypothetical protein
MAKPTTIALALQYMATMPDKWMSTGAIANVIGRSLAGTRSALTAYRADHADELDRRDADNGTLWCYTPPAESPESSGPSEPSVVDWGEAQGDEHEYDDVTLVDELDEAIVALDEMMDALVVIKQVREKLPSLLRRASLGDTILATLDKHISEETK